MEDLELLRQAIEHATDDPNPTKGMKEVLDNIIKQYGKLFAEWFMVQSMQVKLDFAFEHTDITIK